jgi:hypothetical protein
VVYEGRLADYRRCKHTARAGVGDRRGTGDLHAVLRLISTALLQVPWRMDVVGEQISVGCGRHAFEVGTAPGQDSQTALGRAGRHSGQPGTMRMRKNETTDALLPAS